jgi:putative mRNA 3-end processing factor
LRRNTVYIAMLTFTEKGIYLPAADVYIDPWQRVSRALITHAHSDHARPGMGRYVSTPETALIMRQRLGDASYGAIPYGEKWRVRGVAFSFHPAGHVLGSAQIRIEHRGRVAVVTGDYKLENDGFSAPFESLACHEMVTESTFGLPAFHWLPQELVMRDVMAWWRENAAQGKASVLLVYALGKAQRILKALPEDLPGTLVGHGAICQLNEYLIKHGYNLPEVLPIQSVTREDIRRSLILAPGSVLGSAWLQRLGAHSTGYVSGWMALRGNKRRMAVDRGFVLSDHADWFGLHAAIEASGAEKVYVTHGFREPLARWLTEIGREAIPVQTHFTGETVEKSDSDETTTDTQ